MSESERRKQGTEIMDKMLGREQAETVRRNWRAIYPDFERFVVEFLAGEVWTRPGLELRVKSLCTITALAALGRTQGLELNIRMALKNGASKEDILSALLHVAPYIGFPATWEGLTIAKRVFDEELEARS